MILGRDDPPYLTTFEQKTEILASLGLSAAVVEPFTAALAGMDPLAFVERINKTLSPGCIVLGERSRFGRAGMGNVALLAEEGRKLGFDTVAVPPVTVNGKPVSSTAIRALIASGQVGEAAEMLGRFFSIRGPVESGDARGRRLGFPTANVRIPQGQVLPRRGVYALLAAVGGRAMGAVGNIGMRPTFDKQAVSLEVHILGFSGDLYGQTIDVDFVDFLRPEIKFGDPGELVSQVEKDKESALLCLKQRRLIENSWGSC
jgi:riboflavin kinase/FMN adenylyltransferase